MRVFRRRTNLVPVVVMLCLATLTLVAWGAPSENANNPVQAILDLLTDADHGLEEIKNEVKTIEDEVTDADHGLEAMQAEVEAIGERLSASKMSSGVFAIPSGAGALDWMVLNNSSTTQTFTLTVYNASLGGAKSVVERVTQTLAAGRTFHNANSVGSDEPYEYGFYYEVVLERVHPNVLASVHAWEGTSNTPLAGTLIPPGAWTPLE